MTNLGWPADYDDDGRPIGGDVDELPPPSNPMAVARELLADYKHGKDLTLRRWRGDWMRWQDTHWAEAEEAVIRAWLYGKLEHAQYMDTSGKEPESKLWEPTRRKITNVTDALSAITHLEATTSPPAWLAGPGPDGA